MAKVLYVGIGSKARKTKKLYVGVGNKARKVKKAYIGVNGKARLFFSSGVQPGLYFLQNRSNKLSRFDKNNFSTLSSVTLPTNGYLAGTDIPIIYASDGAFGYVNTSREIISIDPNTGATITNSGLTAGVNNLAAVAGSSYGFLQVKTNQYRKFIYDVIDPYTFSTKASITGALTNRYDEYVEVRGTGAGDYFHTIREYEDSDGDTYVCYYRSCMSTGAITYNHNEQYAWESGTHTDDGSYLYIKNGGNGGAFKYDLNKTAQIVNMSLDSTYGCITCAV